MTLPTALRLPRAVSVALLGLLLAFNAVSSALHPALPGVGEVGVSKLTARAPLAVQFREPTAVTKAASGRLVTRQDDGTAGDPALPVHGWAIPAPLPSGILFAHSQAGQVPVPAPSAYRARAPPFAA